MSFTKNHDKIIAMKFFTLITVLMLISAPAKAEDFKLSFEWGDIPLCTSGIPNVVKNPFFKLDYIPRNTKKLYFKMVDKDFPAFKHGGGFVKHKGSRLIKPGAFTYKSPCPPKGSHKYKWTVYALDKDNKTLDVAKSTRTYPE